MFSIIKKNNIMFVNVDTSNIQFQAYRLSAIVIWSGIRCAKVISFEVETFMEVQCPPPFPSPLSPLHTPLKISCL